MLAIYRTKNGVRVTCRVSKVDGQVLPRIHPKLWEQMLRHLTRLQ